MDPIFFGDYPKIMREKLGNKLPQFSDREKELLHRSLDFVGINHYTSRLIAHMPNTSDQVYQVQEIERIGIFFPICIPYRFLLLFILDSKG